MLVHSLWRTAAPSALDLALAGVRLQASKRIPQRVASPEYAQLLPLQASNCEMPRAAHWLPC